MWADPARLAAWNRSTPTAVKTELVSTVLGIFCACFGGFLSHWFSLLGKPGFSFHADADLRSARLDQESALMP